MSDDPGVIEMGLNAANQHIKGKTGTIPIMPCFLIAGILVSLI